MNNLLLSRITKDFLNVDPEVVGGKARYRMGWAGSVLERHPQALSERAKLLVEMRGRFAGLFRQGHQGEGEVDLNTAPRLTPPARRKEGSLRPARYFTRGKKGPTPIPYLLTETNEMSVAKPVPGGMGLLRSLCKGKGVLREAGGLVYLDVDHRFTSMLIPYLERQGLVKLPYFNLFAGGEGSHIPVVPAREAAFQYLQGVEEVGREFTFEIEGLFSMEPSSWPEVEQVWFFKVKSEELELLRQKYFLPARPGGHSFHIAVAVKMRVGRSKTPLPVMRINTAFIAA